MSLKGKATKYRDINNIPNNEYVTYKLFNRKLRRIRKVKDNYEVRVIIFVSVMAYDQTSNNSGSNSLSITMRFTKCLMLFIQEQPI